MIREQPGQMTRSNSQSRGKRAYTVVVERALLDQGQSAFDRGSRAFPRRTERRGLGPATQTGTKTGTLGCGRARVKANVARERRARRTYRPAIDAGGPDRDEYDAVKGGIAAPERFVLGSKIQHARRFTSAATERPPDPC